MTYSKNVKLTVDGEAQRLADLIGRFTADVTDEEVKLAFAPAVEGRELAAVSVNGTAMEVKDPDVFTYPVSPNEDRHTMFAFTVVNKQVLRVMIKAAEDAMRKVDEETILPAVKEAMEKALVNAAAVEESLTSTQEEIDEAWSTLLKALHCIDFVKGDKSQLNYRIDVAEQMDLDDYTTLYVEEFRIALIDAKKVAADENAMDDEITEAADRLEQAMLALVHRADISYLELMISTAKGLDLDAYLDDGKAELAEALAAAEQLADDRDAVQSDVNDAVDALAEALSNLRKAANKDALKGTIRTAESIDLSGYTAKSVARLQEALGNAKAAEGDNTLGEEDQPFVDARTEELQEAIDGLEKENKTHNSSGGGSGKKSRPSTDAVAAVTAPVAPVMKAPSVVSDTTLPFAIKHGSAYCFKMTVKDGGAAVPSFTVGNGAVLKTQFVTRIGNDFYFRVWAVGVPGQQTGVYTTLPGQAPQLQCVVTIG